MRQPRPSDVVEAVRYVTGYDPLVRGRTIPVVKARRLCIHALCEICELNATAIGDVLGYADHSTVLHHLAQPPEYEALREVIQRVSDTLADEDYEIRLRRAEREAAIL